MKPDDPEDPEDEEAESVGAALGRCCAHFVLNHVDIPIFFISFFILYISINRCCYCVLVVAIISALMCMRFPVLNSTLWSAIIVLYLHKDWNINLGDLKITWNRSA